jgi:hypothetical protein
MADEIRISPGLARRIDLVAVANPVATKRNIWTFGVLGVWTLLGTTSSIVSGQWGLAAVFVAIATVSGLMWWVALRAKRRVPETQRWLDELSG